MQEIVLFLSSIAGACTAIAVKKFPKPKTNFVSLGANLHIKNQINSLKLEKEILTKTISRLYENDSGLTIVHRDKMLLKYQHQLGIVLAKIEKLEAASKHPDLGPLGEGLITLMDQKLSQLDKRLYELSSKISVVSDVKPKQVIVKQEHTQEKIQTSQNTQPSSLQIKEVLLPHKPLEITTLTEIESTKIPDFFKENAISTQTKIESIVQPRQERIEMLQSNEGSVQFDKSHIEETNQEEILPKPIEKKPQPTVNLPDDDKIDDDDDLDKIKVEIMKTLSKLEQAEVE